MTAKNVSGINWATTSERIVLRKSKNGDSDMISVPAHLRHMSQKWKVSETLVLKDMRWSEFS